MGRDVRSHGLSGIGLVGLTIAHIYFAIRPEKLWITNGMIFGDISRQEFLQHHDRSVGLLTRRCLLTNSDGEP